MKAYIVDDDISFSTELEMKLIQVGFSIVGKSSNYEHACKHLPNAHPDVIICDVRLGGSHSGVDLAKFLYDMHIPMIFVTAFSDEAIYNEIKKVCSTFKFLVKPFDKLTLKSILDDLMSDYIELYSNNFIRGEYLYIKKNSAFQRITLSDILYLNSEGNYTTLILENEKFIIKYSLSKLLSIEKFNLFIRIHRNYAVNKRMIKRVDFANRLIYTEKQELPFGRTYTKEIRSLMDIPFSGS